MIKMYSIKEIMTVFKGIDLIFKENIDFLLK